MLQMWKNGEMQVKDQMGGSIVLSEDWTDAG